ncbi:DUF3231 family protein [Ammoniphilus resinae]|uniref:Uncharacterized protein n=1 Tax=Ammoniphilus resinae TaxID=861532 RepID=A0ABS4GP56_9BACL|nr:DUF3231 family protein [Ammoniphilus resinae]MBP1931902.1 hypothetical protein [Ammoniphilus resinae]
MTIDHLDTTKQKEHDIEHNPKLTAAEMGSLWAQYMSDSMGIWRFKLLSGKNRGP